MKHFNIIYDIHETIKNMFLSYLNNIEESLILIATLTINT